MTLEIYDASRHLSEISGWGTPLEPSRLGHGLVVAGVACGFIDAIGPTRVVLLYELRANPQVSVVRAMRAILRLAESGLAAAKAAGFTHAILTTQNIVVERTFSERFGFRVTGDRMLEGILK